MEDEEDEEDLQSEGEAQETPRWVRGKTEYSTACSERSLSMRSMRSSGGNISHNVSGASLVPPSGDSYSAARCAMRM